MTYLAFALKERKLLSFAVSLTFFSSFGQTFLIALFVPYFITSFDLTNASFGTLYSAATLVSAFSLPYLGQWIDRIPLRTYSLLVAGGLLASAVLMTISWHVSVLFLALVMVRLTGQGLSGHTAQTTMARFYDHQRGKALSISSLGFPLGEAVLPLIIAGLLAAFHWRVTWVIISLFILIVMMPLLWFLVGKSETVTEKEEKRKREAGTLESYKIIIEHPKLLFILPATLMPPFWATGLFLYQVSFADQLGWTAAIIASSFVGFAATRIAMGLVSGPLVDRFTAHRMFPFILIPMVIGLLIGGLFNGTWSAFVYMALLGATMGMAGTTKSALWAEMFGTGMIGTVRSLFSSIMVVSTAASPFLMGWWLDSGVPMPTIFLIALATTVAAGLLSARLLFGDNEIVQ
ncbi:MAG: MFS transporter [Bacteroidetes bacterium]|jgi:MFS family permease|nr:MFS transporter [Bacteroidota bacterium]